MIIKVMAFILLIISGLGDDLIAIRIGLTITGCLMLTDMFDYEQKNSPHHDR